MKPVSKMTLKKWNTNFRLEYSVRKNGTAFSVFRCSQKFSAETTRKCRVPLTFQPDFPEHFGKCKCLAIDFSLSKATNYKAITCKLRDITTHSKALITWPGLASSFEVTFIPVILEPAWRRHFYKAIGSSVHVSRLVHSPIHPKSLITWRISRRAGSVDM